MKKFKIFLTFYYPIILIVLTSSSTLFAQTSKETLLSLEQKYLYQHFALQELSQQKNTVEFEQRKKHSVYFPNISLSQSRQHTLGKSKQPDVSTQMNVSQSFSPFKTISHDGEGYLLERQLFELEQKAKEFELKKTFRDQFFEILYSKEKISLAKEYLTILQTLYEETLSRFNKGFANDVDLMRSKIQRDKINLSIENYVRNYEAQLSQVKLIWNIIQLPESFSLTESFDFTDHKTYKLNQNLLLPEDSNEKLSIAVQRALLQGKQKELELQAHRLKQLPDLSLSTSLPLGARSGSNQQISLSLKWDLFSGGQDFYQLKVLASQKHTLELFSVRLRTEYKQNFAALKTKLINQNAQIDQQKELIKNYQMLLDNSKTRYLKGLISYKDYIEDLNNLLTERERLYEQVTVLFKLITEGEQLTQTSILERVVSW